LESQRRVTSATYPTGVFRPPTAGVARTGAWRRSSNPIPAVTIDSAVVYVIVRRALSRFYDAFGVELEEVGLGYADVLARAALGVVVVFVAYFMVFGLVLLLAAREFVRRLLRIPRQVPLAILVGAMLTYLIASVVFLGYSARRLADDVVAGDSVRPGSVPSVHALRKRLHSGRSTSRYGGSASVAPGRDRLRLPRHESRWPPSWTTDADGLRRRTS